MPLVLRYDNRQIEVVGLVDSGATVSVLPYDAGLQLGAVWDDRQANIPGSACSSHLAEATLPQARTILQRDLDATGRQIDKLATSCMS